MCGNVRSLDWYQVVEMSEFLVWTQLGKKGRIAWIWLVRNVVAWSSAASLSFPSQERWGARVEGLCLVSFHVFTVKLNLGGD
jgi:hypothetical protein